MASNGLRKSTWVETNEAGVECERGDDEQENESDTVFQPTCPRTV